MAPFSGRTHAKARTSWSSVAFIVESVLLLFFLVASMAVLMRVFTLSLSTSVESRTADAATIAATSVSEHFTADPTGITEQSRVGDLLVTCDVTDEVRTSGTLYHAHIVVYNLMGANPDKPVYSLDTSRYVSNQTNKASSAMQTTASSSAAAQTGASSNAAAQAESSSSAAAQAETSSDADAQEEPSQEEAAPAEEDEAE